LAAVGAALFPRAGADRPSVLGRFGALAVVLLALGTIGGLGSLFAFFVSPKIRGYERVSVYLGFLALAGSAVLFDRLLDRTGGGCGATTTSASCCGRRRCGSATAGCPAGPGRRTWNPSPGCRRPGWPTCFR